MACFILWSWGTKGCSVAGMGVPLNSGNSVPSGNIVVAKPAPAPCLGGGSGSPKVGTARSCCGGPLGSRSPIDFYHTANRATGSRWRKILLDHEHHRYGHLVSLQRILEGRWLSKGHEVIWLLRWRGRGE